jgi:hypothetical protein
VWDNPYSKLNPLSWLNSFIIESTLYHEIGHHVHRHTFGQDPDQEKEANDYSDKIMLNSSHMFSRIMRAIKRVLDLLLSGRKWGETRSELKDEATAYPGDRDNLT